MPAPPLTDLYVQNPGTVAPVATPRAAAPSLPVIERATAASPSASSATATGYKATTQEVKPTDLASAQLNTITSQESPLMKRARQEGIMTAARRGLQNSSISAGAAQGAMVDRAAPIAQQNAQHLLTQAITNQEATNRAAEVSTGRQTDVSVANMQSANQMAAIAAQLATAVSQGNAETANNMRMQMAQLQTQVGMQDAELAQQISLATAQAENTARLQIVQSNSELNRQYLAGTQSVDLATIEANNRLIISTNETAGNIYTSGIDAIAQVQSNPNLDPGRIAQIVSSIQNQIDAGLRFVDAMAGGSPADAKSQLPATPAPPTTQYFPGNIRLPF